MQKSEYYRMNSSYLSIFTFLLCACSNIKINNYEEFNVSSTIITSNTVQCSILETGFSKTLEKFTYQQGKLFKKRRLSHVAVLVKHPQGNFIFDTGLGENFRQQLKSDFSWIHRQLLKTSYKPTQSLKSQLTQYGQIDSFQFIIPSHLHFDHLSGIADFPHLPVWIHKKEQQHIKDKKSSKLFFNQPLLQDSIQWKPFTFTPTPYEVFDQSYDIFKDGSVVLVPLAGHTHGSIGMFVNFSATKRFFFTGDLTWVKEGITELSEKQQVVKKMVDTDQEKIRNNIVKVYQLIQQKPNIQLIPAHDFNAQQNIAHFPKMEKNNQNTKK